MPRTATKTTAARQLAAFIAKFDAQDQRLIRAARKVMRRHLPTAHELVYDNYNFLVMGYSPTLRPSDAVLSLAAQAHALSLCFLYGAGLPDPQNLLRGSGSRVRSLRLASAADLDRPPVRALIAAAIARSRVDFAAKAPGTLVIRSVSARQRPRRKPRAG